MEEPTPPMPELAIAKTTWSDEQRRAVWCLICKSRKGLQVELSPIIASAFVILQYYFRNAEENPYKMFVLMAAALFAACKAGDCYRPMEMVHKELSKILRAAPAGMIKNFVGEDQTLDEYLQPEDFFEITKAEIDLLESVDFNLQFELPFEHFEKWRQSLIAKIPNDSFMILCNQIIIDICLVICSKYYLDVPPEVAAAAAAKDIIPGNIVTDELAEWFDDVRERYGVKVFDFAMHSITDERSRTAFRRPRQKVRVCEDS